MLGEAASTVPGAGTWISILPPLLAIVLALLLRQVIPALFAGLWLGGVQRKLHGERPSMPRAQRGDKGGGASPGGDPLSPRGTAFAPQLVPARGRRGARVAREDRANTLGNAVDRLVWGAVADFLNVTCCGLRNPWAFNVADIAIFVGAFGLIVTAGGKKAS